MDEAGSQLRTEWGDLESKVRVKPKIWTYIGYESFSQEFCFRVRAEWAFGLLL